MAKRDADSLPEQKVVVDIEGQEFTLHLNELAIKMKIDPVNLEDELREQSGFYFWIARIATVANIAAERAKQELELYLAERMDEIRADIEGQGKKVPGVEAIAAKAKAEKEYAERLNDYLAAKENASLATEAAKAVQMRSYMVLAIARGQQQEQAGAEA